MDKMREEFEEWVRRRGGDVMKRDREYISSMTREWWQAWQASRQALVVELPNMPYYDFDMFKLQDALDDAGVRYVWVESESEDK